LFELWKPNAPEMGIEMTAQRQYQVRFDLNDAATTESARLPDAYFGSLARPLYLQYCCKSRRKSSVE
jgi:hypothetical protein